MADTVHRFFSGKQIKPLVSSPPPPDPRGRGKLFKGPLPLSSPASVIMRVLAACIRGVVCGEGFASDGTISTLLHMGIGNARRSRRIIRTPSAIPKLCWMHANCHEGTHPCTSRTSIGCPSRNFNYRSPLRLLESIFSCRENRF